MMFTEAEMAEHRGDAESMMTLGFAVHAPNGWMKLDGIEILGFEDQAPTLGKVQASSGDDSPARTVTIGGVELPVLASGLHIPITSPPPSAGDQGIGWEYECTAVGPVDDPALLGRRFLVVHAPVKSYATARRLDVVELPKEA